MPITPRYQWRQDASSVSIRIELPGATRGLAKKMRFSDLHLSLNASPYLMSLDLADFVVHSRAVVQVAKGCIEVQVPKATPGQIWDSFCAEGTADELSDRRQQSFERARKQEQDEMETTRKKAGETKSRAQSRTWAEEDEERTFIRSLKETEERNAKDDVADWAGRMHDPAAVSTGAEGPAVQTAPKDEPSVQVPPVSAPVRSLPPVTTFFTFTDHRAGGVARDPDEDDEFAPTSSLLDGDERDLGERHFIMLKEKAAKFFESGDYLSAISAFSAALSAKPSDPGCLSNRAACYLKLATSGGAIAKKFQRVHKCVDDCNVALSVLGPNPTGSKRKLRAKILVRRGTANSMLGHFKPAVSDYEDALNLMHGADIGLINDLKWLMDMVRRQDARAEADAIDDDIDAVNDALDVDPCNARLLLKKAQILADDGRPDESVDAVTEALAVLDDHALCRRIPDDEMAALRGRMLQLRGDVLLRLNRLVDAGFDLRMALQISPSDKQTEDLIAQVQSRMNDVVGGSRAERGAERDPDEPTQKNQGAELVASAKREFQNGDVVRSKRLFTDALRLQQDDPVQHASILSNRAACELFLKEYDACIRDCTASMDVCEQGGRADARLMAATLSRRASAHCAMGAVDLARRDLLKAISVAGATSDLGVQLQSDLDLLDRNEP
ncbi:unnamed protein product (mitochondrion) [Plasmodiophora brassicae]|uniref:CS domain-containing protein n=1 Tax=Plasmodiophora brassicae TaxID=37360 RepID=A0A3P3YBB7_PLABS|nr:unnamed protein product [Plasmodiophora brassicae]